MAAKNKILSNIKNKPYFSKDNFVLYKSDCLKILEQIPENSIDFYRPVVEWLDTYAESPAKITQVNIQLEYFNTSSSKCILDVFKKLENVFKKNNEEGVTINWYYEEDDEDMLEAGEDYQSILKIPFKMIEMEE